MKVHYRNKLTTINYCLVKLMYCIISSNNYDNYYCCTAYVVNKILVKLVLKNSKLIIKIENRVNRFIAVFRPIFVLSF